MNRDSGFTETPEYAAKFAEVVKSALEFAPEDRRSFIEQTCAGDPAMRAEIEALLKHEERAVELTAQPLAQLAGELLDGALEPDRLIGRYRIIEVIGRGGMGEVYRAHDEKLDRQVALKLVRRAMSTAQFIRRFNEEARILARLNHPNIAQLYDGGVTDDGLSYFAMELIDGMRIDEFCQQQRTTLRDRVALFQQVCAAVHYAHQHLIVHRDLKPSNILVTRDGQPKLLDFGVAKLLEGHETDPAMTLAGVMTADFASPEQVRGEPATTASDIYSLGVILFELLTGQRPYRVKTRTPQEISRAVVEQEPARPSSAIAAGDRNSKLLMGDLDHIVLMALRKEPARRYPSVAQFSDDLGRYLEGRAVIAGGDSISYRATKFVRRNKVAVGAASVIVATLLAGTIAISLAARRAQTEAAKSNRMNAFLREMLSAPDPTRKGRAVTVAEVLDEAARRLETLDDTPDVAAAVRQTLGNTYNGLGLFGPSETQLREALEISRRTHGARAMETARAMSDLARLFDNKGNYAEGESLFRSAIAIEREHGRKGEADLADTLWWYADLLIRKGDSAGGEKAASESLALARRQVPQNRIAIATSLNLLGLVHDYRGDLAGAESLYRQAVEAGQKIPGFPLFLNILTNLATNLTTQKHYDEAEVIFNDALTRARETYGDNHPATTLFLIHFGRFFMLKGDHERAEQMLTKALTIQRATLPPDHADLPQSLSLLGLVRLRQNDAEAGERLLREAVAIREKILPNGHWLIANVRSGLGEAIEMQGRFEEAQPLLLSSYEEMKNTLGPKHPRSIEASDRLVKLYLDWGKGEEAARYRTPASQ